MAARMAVVIDYQNVHLTVSQLYFPGRPIEEGLIEPFRFAKQLAKARNSDGGTRPRFLVSKCIGDSRSLTTTLTRTEGIWNNKIAGRAVMPEPSP